MFRKSKIAVAVLAAAAATSAQAVFVNEDGRGEVVLIPYYNVNNNFVTNVNVTNTTSQYKAVKLRFRESGNSADVLDFNIYMSPFDIWDATIRLNQATGRANIFTTDETCTYPDKALLQAGQDFLDFYDDVDAEDVTEGYIEIYEMGVIADGPGGAIDEGKYAEINASANPPGRKDNEDDRIVVEGLEHDSDGMPEDCSVVADAWNAGDDAIDNGDGEAGGFTKGALNLLAVAETNPRGLDIDDGGDAIDALNDPYWGSDFGEVPVGVPLNNGLVRPTGGINAYGIMINTETGAAFVEEGIHISRYADVPQHYRSDDPVNYLLPSLSSGDNIMSTMLDRNGNGVTYRKWNLTHFDTGALNDISPNPSIPMGANPFPISSILAAGALGTPFFVNPDAGGETDAVLTMPMRKHGVYNGGVLDVQIDTDDDPCESDLVVVSGATFLSGEEFAKWPEDDGEVCDNWAFTPKGTGDAEISVIYWDTEEQVFEPTPDAPGFSPVVIGAPTETVLPREVNVIVFTEFGGTPDSLLGTPENNLTRLNLQDGWTTGWARITFQESSMNTDAGNIALVDPENCVDCSLTEPLADSGDPDQLGVPVIGFTAMGANVGANAQVGETVEHIRWIDRSELGTVEPGEDGDPPGLGWGGGECGLDCEL